jgi:hypothetical protein
VEKERRKKVKRIIRSLAYYIGFVLTMPIWTLTKWVSHEDYDLKEAYNAAKYLYCTASRDISV